MKKTLLVALSGLMCAGALSAQVTVKKDVTQYYSQLPAMPGSLQDAYSKCTCKSNNCSADSLVAPIKRSVNADSKAQQTLTATQVQQKDSGTALANKMKTDGVDKMTDDQKLQYVQNNQQLNGGNAQAIAFAQKMKDDPAEKARLQAMPRDQQIAYLQANGALNTNPNMQATAAMKKQMSDSNKGSAALGKQKDMMSNENGADCLKLWKTLDSLTSASTTNVAQNKIDAGGSSGSGLSLGKLGGELGEAGSLMNKATAGSANKKNAKKHADLATQQLQDMTKAYQNVVDYLKKNETDFEKALEAISYGYTGDDHQDVNLNTLAQGQAFILNNIDKLSGYVKTIYEFGASWQTKTN